MSATIKDGGPAFPITKDNAISPVTDIAGNDISSGMTKRELIAMHALAGLLANAEMVKIEMMNARGSQTRADVLADVACDCADALIAALKAQEPQS